MNVGSAAVVQPEEATFVELGSIRGSVTNDELVPVPNSTVLLTESNVQVRSALDGSFEFLSVPPGKYALEVQAPGHVGQSSKVEVKPGQVATARFVLKPLPVIEPHVSVVQRTIVMHALGPAYLIPSNNEATCSDKCEWWIGLPNSTRHVLIEATGKHPTPNPLGWDGMQVSIEGYSAKDSANRIILRNCGGLSEPRNETCLRLPQRIPLLDPSLHPGTGTVPSVERLRARFLCDPTWFCLEERHEIYAASFIHWEGEEIPPGYSAVPGG